MRSRIAQECYTQKDLRSQVKVVAYKYLGLKELSLELKYENWVLLYVNNNIITKKMKTKMKTSIKEIEKRNQAMK